jgi:hypothetical protein
MQKTILLTLMLILSIGFFSSCNKDEILTETEVENYTNETITSLETRNRIGRGACFELVFPVSINLPDNSIVEVDSYDELRATIKEYIKNNGRPNNRPYLINTFFVYPITVITQEGETVTVNGREELIELRKECVRKGGGQGRPCFRLNYPVSISYPDGTQTYNTPSELRIALKEWKKNNPNPSTHPQLVYPLTVTLEDGTIQTIATRSDFIKLKENCN